MITDGEALKEMVEMSRMFCKNLRAHYVLIFFLLNSIDLLFCKTRVNLFTDEIDQPRSFQS